MSEYNFVDNNGLIELVERGLRKGYWDKALIPELKKRFKELEKKEKLLELYKELSKLKDDVIHSVMFEKDYEHLRVKIIKIEKQIKELENE